MSPRGGSREGAGRPPLPVPTEVAITAHLTRAEYDYVKAHDPAGKGKFAAGLRQIIAEHRAGS